MAFQTTGNDPRHGLIAVAHKYLFAVANELNMGAELSFQIADIDSSHAAIIADVTMLVICYIVWNARAIFQTIMLYVTHNYSYAGS
jgi:hypothetical protein